MTEFYFSQLVCHHSIIPETQRTSTFSNFFSVLTNRSRTIPTPTKHKWPVPKRILRSSIIVELFQHSPNPKEHCMTEFTLQQTHTTLQMTTITYKWLRYTTRIFHLKWNKRYYLVYVPLFSSQPYTSYILFAFSTCSLWYKFNKLAVPVNV